MTPHWTEEQLIAHLYGVGPDDRHLDSCHECQARLSRMQAHRHAIESESGPPDVDLNLLAAQRREIYAAIAQPVPWWSQLQLRRWASAFASVAIFASALLLYENHRKPATPDSISDKQLAQEVSRIAQDPEPPATAPLQALFEE
jgi:anti-sigma factor RsiW